MKLKILRFTSPIPTTPVYGVFFIGHLPTFVTLELPYLDNQPNISSIPLGHYKLFLRPASKHLTADIGQAYELKDVPSRSDILIHVGNTVKDSNGCVLLGMSFGLLGDVFGVTESIKAYRRMMKLLDGQTDLTLDIIQA